MLKKKTWLRVAAILTSLATMTTYAGDTVTYNLDLDPVESQLSDVNSGINSVNESVSGLNQGISDISAKTDLVNTSIQSVDENIKGLLDAIIAVNTGVDRLFLLEQCVVNIFKNEVWGLNLSEMMAQDRLLMEGNLQVREFQKTQDTIFSTLLLMTSGTPMPTFLQTGKGELATVQTYVKSTLPVTADDIQKLKDEMNESSDGETSSSASRARMLDAMQASTYISATALSNFFGQYLEADFADSSSSPWAKSSTSQIQSMIDKYFTPAEGKAPPQTPPGCLYDEAQSDSSIPSDGRFSAMVSPGGEELPPLTIEDFNVEMLEDYLLSSNMEQEENSSGEKQLKATSPYLMQKKLVDMLTNASLVSEDSGLAGLMRRQVMMNAFMLQELHELVSVAKQQLALTSISNGMTGAMTMEFIRGSLQSEKAQKDLEGKMDEEKKESEDSEDYEEDEETDPDEMTGDLGF